MSTKFENFEVPLAGEPTYHNPAAGNDFYDARFAPPDSRGNGLKPFVEAERARREGTRRVILPGDIPADVAFDGEKWNCYFVYEGRKIRAEGKLRDAAVMNAAKYVTNASAKKDIRELGEGQLAFVASLAQSGNLVGALDQYIAFAIPSYKEVSDRKILSDAKYRPVLDAAAWHVWAHSSLGNEYSLGDAAFPAFAEEFCRGKFLTISLIDDCWKLYKQQRQRKEIAATFGEPTDPRKVQQGLDEMSDDEIKTQFWRTAKHVANASRYN